MNTKELLFQVFLNPPTRGEKPSGESLRVPAVEAILVLASPRPNR